MVCALHPQSLPPPGRHVYSTMVRGIAGRPAAVSDKGMKRFRAKRIRSKLVGKTEWVEGLPSCGRFGLPERCCGAASPA